LAGHKEIDAFLVVFVERQTFEYQGAQTRTKQDCKEAESSMAGRRQLSDDEEVELAALWKKLVRLYHPDRFATEPEKMD
jgi:DNA polymerase-3 subunit epsilon